MGRQFPLGTREGLDSRVWVDRVWLSKASRCGTLHFPEDQSFASVGKCSVWKLKFKVGPVLIQIESIVKVQNNQDLETWYYVTTSAVSPGSHFPHWITLPVSRLCFVWLLYPVWGRLRRCSGCGKYSLCLWKGQSPEFISCDLCLSGFASWWFGMETEVLLGERWGLACHGSWRNRSRDWKAAFDPSVPPVLSSLLQRMFVNVWFEFATHNLTCRRSDGQWPPGCSWGSHAPRSHFNYHPVLLEMASLFFEFHLNQVLRFGFIKILSSWPTFVIGAGRPALIEYK